MLRRRNRYPFVDHLSQSRLIDYQEDNQYQEHLQNSQAADNVKIAKLLDKGHKFNWQGQILQETISDLRAKGENESSPVKKFIINTTNLVLESLYNQVKIEEFNLVKEADKLHKVHY